jgi:hypothetical protein
MPWQVVIVPELEVELRAFDGAVRVELLAKVALLREFGPKLGRPHVDTLAGSRLRNLKELRFDAAGGVWRVASAFDPDRRAVVLAAASKSGTASLRFYDRLDHCPT